MYCQIPTQFGDVQSFLELHSEKALNNHAKLLDILTDNKKRALVQVIVKACL